MQTSRPKRRSRVGRPSNGETAQRAELLVDAAVEVFVEMGYKGASIEAIARRANISKQTIYARFPTKAELFKEIMRILSERVRTQFEAILVDGADLEAVLMRYGENLISFLGCKEVNGVTQTIVGALPDFPELAEHFWHLAISDAPNPLAAYLQAQRDRGLLRFKDAVQAAEHFEGLCISPLFLMRAMIGLPQQYSPSELYHHLQEAIRIFLASYGASGRKTPSTSRRTRVSSDK
jgi:AcrR family transcriptional regulator